MTIDPSWQIVAAILIGWFHGFMVGLVVERDRPDKPDKE